MEARGQFGLGSLLPLGTHVRIAQRVLKPQSYLAALHPPPGLIFNSQKVTQHEASSISTPHPIIFFCTQIPGEERGSQEHLPSSPGLLLSLFSEMINSMGP